MSTHERNSAPLKSLLNTAVVESQLKENFLIRIYVAWTKEEKEADRIAFFLSMAIVDFVNAMMIYY